MRYMNIAWDGASSASSDVIFACRRGKRTAGETESLKHSVLQLENGIYYVENLFSMLNTELVKGFTMQYKGELLRQAYGTGYRHYGNGYEALILMR